MRILDVEPVCPEDRPGLTGHLLPGETVHEAFRALAGLTLFTNRRIVTIQRHTLLNERVETTSFSYSAIRQFSVLQGPAEESRSEVRIWLGADPQPLHLRSTGGADFSALQRLLAEKLH